MVHEAKSSEAMRGQGGKKTDKKVSKNDKRQNSRVLLASIGSKVIKSDHRSSLALFGSQKSP